MRWSVFLAILTITIACLVLIGWEFNISVLKRPIPRLVAMNPATAVLFIFSGTASLLFSIKQPLYRKQFIASAITILVILISLLKLMDLGLGINMEVDTILFSKKLSLDAMGNVSNRMAPNTAACFILVGVSPLLYLLLQRKTRMLLKVTN